MLSLQNHESKYLRSWAIQLLAEDHEVSPAALKAFRDHDSKNYSAFDALDQDGNFNANGYSLKIWGNFLGKKMIKTSSSLHIPTSPAWIRKKRNYMYTS